MFYHNIDYNYMIIIRIFLNFQILENDFPRHDSS